MESLDMTWSKPIVILVTIVVKQLWRLSFFVLSCCVELDQVGDATLEDGAVALLCVLWDVLLFACVSIHPGILLLVEYFCGL